MTLAMNRISLRGILLAAALALGLASSALSQGTARMAGGTGEGQFFRGGVAGSTGMAGGHIWLPNGKYSEYTEDLRIKVPGGHVRWGRDFNGNQWRFNPQWSSLEFEFDTVALYGSGGGGGGGGGAAAIALPSAPPEVFGGTRVPGSAGSMGPGGRTGPLWAISRNGAWFTVDATYCNFIIKGSTRHLLKPVFAGSTPACPTNRFAGQATLASGASGEGAVIRPTPAGGMPDGVAGFRWEDRNGDWIEYDRDGRISAYGDRNQIKVTMQYTGGHLTGVLDHDGRLVMSIGYDGERVTEVRDLPRPGDPAPVRVVRYAYDAKGSIASVTDVRGHLTRYGYDDKARLSSVTDAEGRVRRIEYGPTGRVTKLIQPDNSTTEYEYDYDSLKKRFLARVKRPEVNGQRRVEVSLYDVDGQLITQEVNNRVQRELSQDGRTDRIIDARGNITETKRNDTHQVVSVRYADGATQSHTFDPRTLELVQQRDVDGYTHHYERDEAGNLRRRVMAVGTPDERSTEFTRDTRQRVTTAVLKGRTESNGAVTPDASYSFEYDEQDNLTKLTDPESKVTTYTHNRLGQILTETDPRGGTWRYSYDAAGHLLSATSPLGFVTSYEYDKVGNEIRMTDARGKVYASVYDARNREIESLDPYGNAYRTDYTALGTMASVTDAAGKSLRFEYDAWTRPVQAWDGKGFNYAMDYTEPDGKDSGARQPSKVKYPTFERLLQYNPRNRPLQKTDLDGSDGRTEHYSYDGAGRRKSVTDANGRTRTLDYNAFGQLTRMADSMGNAMRLAYDAHGNLIEITDPNGRKTRFDYDRRGLMTGETDPLGKTTRYAYDDNGWPTSTALPNGTKVEYQHDADGRLTQQKEYAAGGALAKTTSFDYDQEDNLLGWSDGRYSATLSYDDAERLSSETVHYGSFSKSRSYTYYPNNQVKSYTGPDGVTISYAYDALGQLERVSIPGEGDISVTEWHWAARKKVLLPGGTEQRFSHDGLLMTTGLKVVNPGQSTVFELEEKYGKLHEVNQVKRDGAATSYGYDDAYRLTSLQAPNAAFNEGYTVDAAGNRVTHSRGGSPVGGTWTYDAANQLKQRGSLSYDYDDNGNLVSRTDSGLAEPQRTTRYVYDTFNRLSEVRDGAGTLLARYSYDPFDRRLSKQLGEGSEITYYLPSPSGLLAEMNAAGHVLVSYGWHPEHEDGTYPLYARMGDGAGGTRTVYYHNDHLGTPQRITDKAGALVWAADYDGFGKATVRSTLANPVTNHLRYPGQYFDAETGLHYNDRRYYDPETGRYITRDPVGFAGGVNLYAYASHSPTNVIDPTGEIPPFVIAPVACVAYNYTRCVATCMLMSAAVDYFVECGNINWGDNAKDCAIDCLLGMLPIPNPCGKFGQWMSTAMGVAGGLMSNSFMPETLVHVRPPGAGAEDARQAKAVLKPIGELKPGDEVLALAEWKDKGNDAKADARLGYERVTDVFTSQREQTLVHLTLDSGETITATEGHPFRTSEGWRDAVLLKRGGQLLLKGSEGDGSVRVATLADVRIEKKTVQVFNLEVANAHTFFVGIDGALVHNAQSVNQMNQDIERGDAPGVTV